MVAAVATSLEHILGEEEQTIGAANQRHIYSLFDDEQDWTGLLSAIDGVQPESASSASSRPNCPAEPSPVASQAEKPGAHAGAPAPAGPSAQQADGRAGLPLSAASSMLSLVPSDVDLQGLGASEAGMLSHQQRVASRQSPTPQAYNLSGTPTGSGQNLSGTPSSGSGGSPPPQPPPTSLLSPTTPTPQMTLQLPQGPSPTPALQHPQPRPAGYEVPQLPTQRPSAVASSCHLSVREELVGRVRPMCLEHRHDPGLA